MSLTYYIIILVLTWLTVSAYLLPSGAVLEAAASSQLINTNYQVSRDPSHYVTEKNK